MIAYIQNPGYEKEYLACQKAMQVSQDSPICCKILRTPMIRMKRLSVFSKKEMPVFPRPWIMLMSALLAYKNGHIQERVRMNSPARELWKSSLPNAGPSRKNPARHPVPRKMQPQRELRNHFLYALYVFLSLGFCDSR